MDFSTSNIKNKVVYLTKETNSFSDVYIAVRDKEQRVLTDKDVALLPHLKHNEWEYRIKSTERFTNYISLKKERLSVLDIGCGNGWFTNAIAKVSNKNKVIGLDINREELEQAARVFKRPNLQFVYGDIFKIEEAFNNKFDIITLNSCVQYFQDFKALFSTLKLFLKPHGEIHIIDSPFYKPSQLAEAKKRTLAYYTTLGFPEMASNYFHHSFSDIQQFELLYSNKNKLLNKILNKKDSPFPWIRYSNKD